MRAVEEQEARLERAASIVARERSPVLFASFFFLGGGVVFASIYSSCQPAGSLGVDFLFLYIGPNGYLIPARYTITMFNT